jgi:transcriptional regulator with XRE-family HTH domain
MDGVGDSSTVRRILLGSLLRRLRESKGIAMREAGYHIRATESKISRLETGKVSFKERDVADLLTFYGVLDEKERDQVLDLVREANTLGWWHSFGEVLPPWFEAYVGLESAASVVRTYEVQFIPGLLQCPEYVSAVVSANRTLTTAELSRRIELRMRRQETLERENGPVLWVVLDEAALRRPIGGSEVMRTQIRYLIEQAGRPNVTIQLLPYSVGAHAAEGGAFTLLRFAEADLPDVVYLEHLTGAQYIEKPDEVEQYARAMDRISVDALHPDATINALESLLK